MLEVIHVNTPSGGKKGDTQYEGRVGQEDKQGDLSRVTVRDSTV